MRESKEKERSPNTISAMRMMSLEQNAEYFGISRLQLMENAGKNIAQEIYSRFNLESTRVAIFCGLGGNGGDGFVAARHLASLGFDVKVVLAGKASEITSEEARKNWKSLTFLREKVFLIEIRDSTLIPDIEAQVFVDALLGIGLKGPPRPPILQLVNLINNSKAFRIAVDIPTGLDADSGEVFSDAVTADLTLTFHKAKPSLNMDRSCVGELVVAPIGIPTELEKFAGPGDVRAILKNRLPESHKGDFGKLLVIGGSTTYIGAPTLAALAALRTGVDVVIVAAPRESAYSISSISPNIIAAKMVGEHLNPLNLQEIRSLLGKSSAVAIGPGLGLHEETQSTVKHLIELVEDRNIPLLLDADGLKAFAGSKRRLQVPCVITPHVGEYEILVKERVPEKLEERIEHVRRVAATLGVTVLLKSHVDIVSNGSEIKLNFTGNPGMTVGGTGDVLSGIVGALLAQGTEPFEAAVAGAFINGAAGDFVRSEKRYHMVASDLLDFIPRVMENPMEHSRIRNSYVF